jgi:hypothetical protein
MEVKITTIDEVGIVLHLDLPALSLRVKRPEAQPLSSFKSFMNFQ